MRASSLSLESKNHKIIHYKLNELLSASLVNLLISFLIGCRSSRESKKVSNDQELV